jgi:hypothetical protein
MWYTIKRFINNNAEYLGETLLYLLLAYIITLALHRLLVGPFTSESDRQHGETTDQYYFRYGKLVDDPNFQKRRRWRRVRGSILWLGFVFGAVPYIAMRQPIIW